MRQRFYSPKSYKPKVYGYRHAMDVDDSGMIVAYANLRSLAMTGIELEPHSHRSLSAAFRRREGGTRLLELLKPEDHLVIARYEHAFYDREDFLNQMRWFYEHGIHVHFCDINGSPLDCWSHPGRVYIDTLLSHVELDCLKRRVTFHEKKPKPLHNSKPIPWFCSIDVAANRLTIPDNKRRILERAVALRDQGERWSKISHWLYEEYETLTGGGKLAAFKGKEQEAKNAYCFYKGWEEAGFPDLNDVSPAKLKQAYKAKLFGGQDATETWEEPEDDLVEHSGAEELREAAEAGGGDSPA